MRYAFFAGLLICATFACAPRTAADMSAAEKTAIADTQLATSQYVKRQLTWCRNRMKDWRWMDNPEDLSNFLTVNNQ